MTGETMNETEQALTEAVANAIADVVANIAGETSSFVVLEELRNDDYLRMTHAAIAAVRAHDEQAALNCGHCTPNADEIACGCKIEERYDE